MIALPKRNERRAPLATYIFLVCLLCSGCGGLRSSEQTALDPNWWKGAVIYEIYPRSFADTTGDGVGDLNGITSHLDYLKDLGVDGIWITPFYPSPQVDFGYDVTDYSAVDKQYGTIAGFDLLVREAGKRNIKVLTDLVLNHTSDQHPWFQESRSSRTNAKADWYIWVDDKPDAPPNNWLSIFGHSAWQWDETRKQYSTTPSTRNNLTSIGATHR